MAYILMESNVGKSSIPMEPWGYFLLNLPQQIKTIHVGQMWVNITWHILGDRHIP